MLLKNNLNGFQHLGIPVADINAAKEWYLNLFGFEVVHEPEIVTDEGIIKLAFIRLNDIVLEFYQLVGDALKEVKGRDHGHIDHLAIDTLDLTSAVNLVRKKGAEFVPATSDGPGATPQFWSKGGEAVFLKATNGEKVELTQRSEQPLNKSPNNFQGWSYLGIPVTDIDHSLAFYRQFGFEVEMTADLQLKNGSKLKALMIALNGFAIKLYQLPPSDGDTPAARKDGFIDHVALNVKNVDQAFEELTAAGVATLEEAPIVLPFWENGVKFFNIRGPDGEKIEFGQIL